MKNTASESFDGKPDQDLTSEKKPAEEENETTSDYSVTEKRKLRLSDTKLHVQAYVAETDKIIAIRKSEVKLNIKIDPDIPGLDNATGQMDLLLNKAKISWKQRIDDEDWHPLESASGCNLSIPEDAVFNQIKAEVEYEGQKSESEIIFVIDPVSPNDIGIVLFNENGRESFAIGAPGCNLHAKVLTKNSDSQSIAVFEKALSESELVWYISFHDDKSGDTRKICEGLKCKIPEKVLGDRIHFQVTFKDGSFVVSEKVPIFKFLSGLFLVGRDFSYDLQVQGNEMGKSYTVKYGNFRPGSSLRVDQIVASDVENSDLYKATHILEEIRSDVFAIKNCLDELKGFNKAMSLPVLISDVCKVFESYESHLRFDSPPSKRREAADLLLAKVGTIQSLVNFYQQRFRIAPGPQALINECKKFIEERNINQNAGGGLDPARTKIIFNESQFIDRYAALMYGNSRGALDLGKKLDDSLFLIPKVMKNIESIESFAEKTEITVDNPLDKVRFFDSSGGKHPIVEFVIPLRFFVKFSRGLKSQDRDGEKVKPPMGGERPVKETQDID